LLGLSGLVLPDDSTNFGTTYEEGANFEGTETVREALNAVAEATQTIYYIDTTNRLVFKKLGAAAVSMDINKELYIKLDSGSNRRLAAICHITELGDNIEAKLEVSGTTQYVRNNPFWDMREDITTLVDAALENIGGLTINQFNCSWRGNPLLEIGDKISLETKDGDIVYSYILDDVITYAGTLSEVTQWSYAEEDEETATNPSSIGEAVKQTYAKVDKINKEIDLLASEMDGVEQKVSSLKINTDSINASVIRVEKNVNDSLGDINEALETITKKVEATITEEDIRFAISNELANGVSSVTTTTGFKFDEEGLEVSKTDSEMSTSITEDGMTVYKNGEAVLTANNVGVDAVNLRAVTYLIIGKNSRFEDYEDVRTGCFYIGG
jgi:hypothetical protein